MSLVVTAPKDHRLMLRAATALVALLLAALVVFGLGALFFQTMPVAPKHPFGVGIHEAAQGGSGFGRWLLAQAEWLNRQLEQGLIVARDQGGLALGIVLLAFGYGIFHAGGPGHGKVVISAYLIANEQALWRGIVLSTASALLQALVAIAIVLVARLVLNLTAPAEDQLTTFVELASFAAIALFGLVLTWRKAAPVAARLAPGEDHRLDAHAHAAAFDHHEHHHHHGHAHDHDGRESCDHHVPVEFVQSRSFRWRDALPVVVAAGSRPCSGAIIILVFALSQGLVGAGLAAVFAMAAGVAITVSALATLAVFAKRAARRFAGSERRFAFAAIELMAAAFVATLGFGLMSGLAMISAG
jgi:nickel/cobalt exporter